MKNFFTIKNFDLAIIGSGGSGLMTAITAHDHGLKNIAIISKVIPSFSHTVSAKGGINASLGNVSKDDWKFHAYDTIKGGDFLADVDVVELLCKNANQVILELEKYGMAFSRNEKGLIDQRVYGGQTLDYGSNHLAYRACYAQDKTGLTMSKTLEQQAIKKNIKFYNEFFIIDLLVENNKNYGCIAIDLNNGEIVVFICDNVVIASGGYSQIFNNTTSSTICTGDGTALAIKEGLWLEDMEFIQFHPTGLYQKGFLITEAVRSEGGHLINHHGERFMKHYASNMMELASRDIICRAIGSEIAKNNIDSNLDDCVFLDMRHFEQKQFIKLPNVLEIVKKFTGKDPSKDLIAVSPSAHYTMGGIPCNPNGKVIDGLYAVGEVACLSVHGANRLGCNSLLDLIVFGKIAGQKIAENYQAFQINKNEINLKLLVQKKLDQFYQLFEINNSFNSTNEIISIKITLKKINEKSIGIYRNKNNLENGFDQIIKLYKQFKKLKISNNHLIWNEELINYFEVQNLILNSIVVHYSAINRCESRGSHYRDDFNLRDDINFLAHSMVRIVDLDQIKLEYNLKPVNIISQIPELNLKPSIRKY